MSHVQPTNFGQLRKTPRDDILFEINTTLGKIDKPMAEIILKLLKEEESKFRGRQPSTEGAGYKELTAHALNPLRDQSVTDSRFMFSLPETQPSLNSGILTISSRTTSEELLMRFLNTINFPKLFESASRQYKLSEKQRQEEKLRQQVLYEPKVEFGYDRLNEKPEATVTFKIFDGHARDSFPHAVGKMIRIVEEELIRNGCPLRFEEKHHQPLRIEPEDVTRAMSRHWINKGNTFHISLNIPPGTQFKNDPEAIKNGLNRALAAFTGVPMTNVGPIANPNTLIAAPPSTLRTNLSNLLSAVVSGWRR